MTGRGLFIDGKWCLGTGARFRSLNPCTQETLWEGTAAAAPEIKLAIDAARSAFDGWGGRTFEQRVEILKRYQSVLKDEKQAIAETIATETGKPLWESLTEAAAMIGKIDLSIAACEQRTGQSQRAMSGAVGRLRHKPHGVVAVYGPYNFPGHLPNGHIVPALLAGNTVILKPSELTPKVAQKMVGCFERAQLPPGVVNLLQGEKETGIELAQQAEIDGLFFTGSATTGALLRAQFAEKPSKILALELGGNNPLIVWDVDDVAAAVYHIIQSAYLTAGQRCTCARRLIIPTGEVGDQLIALLCDQIDEIKVGPSEVNPPYEAPFMGPVISNGAADRLLETQLELRSAGGVVLREMKRLEKGLPFLSPGLMDVTPIADVPDEEAFGPFLQIIRVGDFLTAIDVANDTRFGLSAGLLSSDRARWELFYQRCRAGVVNWNRPLTGASGAAPFGGIGASGNHRPSAYYAADYCAYPVATIESETLALPEKLPPGLKR